MFFHLLDILTKEDEFKLKRNVGSCIKDHYYLSWFYSGTKDRIVVLEEERQSTSDSNSFDMIFRISLNSLVAFCEVLCFVLTKWVVE